MHQSDDRLLPGESSTSTDLEDVAHWIAVYAELVEFLQRPELLPVAEIRERYERRLAFWDRRREELVEGRTRAGKSQ